MREKRGSCLGTSQLTHPPHSRLILILSFHCLNVGQGLLLSWAERRVVDVESGGAEAEVGEMAVALEEHEDKRCDFGSGSRVEDNDKVYCRDGDEVGCI